MGYLVAEYLCATCGVRFESFEARNDVPSLVPCAKCNGLAPRVISAPSIKAPRVEVTRGKSDAPPPHVMDTRALGDGMPVREWRQQRQAQRVAERHAEMKRLLS